MVISDLHGKIRWAGRARDIAARGSFDCIVVCGDITNLGPASIGIDAIKTLVKVGLPVLYVAGNMDPPNILIELEGLGVNLHGKGEIIQGVGFAGAGFENNLKTLLEEGIRQIGRIETYVLVTHVPPYGTNVDVAWDDTHIGSREVREVVNKYQPAALLCGHIHESRGQDKIGRTIICNPGPIYNGYYAVLHLTEEVRVELLEIE